jgi:putative N6-adenine-specific DNA methylase
LLTVSARDAVTSAAAAVRAALGEPGEPATRWALWASTPVGCEPEAAAELAAFGWRQLETAATPGSVARAAPTGAVAGLAWDHGAVWGACDPAGMEATLRAARIPTRLSWLAASTRAHSLDEVAAAVRRAPLALPDATFAVIAHRRGQQPFRSPDIAAAAGAAVIDAHRARTGRRLPVDLDSPAVVVRVELVDERLRIGCELTAGSRHRRRDLMRRHRAGLNPAVAATLVALAGWDSGQHLLDPMCGAGTIPVEAARAARREPPPLAVGDRLDALGWRDAGAAAAADTAVEAVRAAPGLAITAVDHDPASCDATRANLAAAGVAGAVSVRRDDARRLEGIASVDAVAANPPYGLRQGRSRELASLYEASLRCVSHRLIPGGRVVWLTPAHRVATRAATAAGLVGHGRRTLALGAFDAAACRFVRPRT